MELTFKIGSRAETVNVEDERVLGILEPDDLPEGGDEEALVTEALNNPVGSEKLSEIVSPDETVAIVTSDITRPCPTWKILPSVLKELYAAGVKKENITLVFALGSHRHHTEAEMIHLAGEEAYREITCIDSDPDDTVHLGTTSRGTPVTLTEESWRPTDGSASAMWKTITSLASPAAPRRSCRASRHAMQFSTTTATW